MCIDRRGGCSATWSGCWVSGLSVTLYVPVGPLADVCVCVRARVRVPVCVSLCVVGAVVRVETDRRRDFGEKNL